MSLLQRFYCIPLYSLSYLVAVCAVTTPGSSPFTIADSDLKMADNKLTVKAMRGEMEVDSEMHTIKTCKVSGIRMIMSELRPIQINLSTKATQWQGKLSTKATQQ